MPTQGQTFPIIDSDILSKGLVCLVVGIENAKPGFTKVWIRNATVIDECCSDATIFVDIAQSTSICNSRVVFCLRSSSMTEESIMDAWTWTVSGLSSPLAGTL